MMTSSTRVMKLWLSGKLKNQANQNVSIIGFRSGEALELSQIIKKLGLNKDICSEEYLFKFFETFYAQKNNIQAMDS